ncbi:MAG: T9SS type A sorting domain-containing protein [Chitinophagales bacterium]
MKKLYLLLSFCFVGFLAFAQDAQHASGLLSKPMPDRFPGGTQPVTANDLQEMRSEGGDSRALSYYWLNFSDAVDYVFNGGLGENIDFMVMWPDSTAVVTDGAGGIFHWYIHGYTHLFDPLSEYHAEFVNANYTLIGDAADWFTEDHAFHVDSMAFYYAYIRPNTGYVDTLKVYLIGPASGAIDLDAYTYDSDGDGTFFEEGEDAIIDATRYDDGTNGTYGTGVTEYTFLLDNDDSTSFATQMIIPVDYTIPDNDPEHFIGAAFQFIPGGPYSFGDTLLEQSDPPLPVTNPLNNFYLVVYEEIADSDPASFTENTSNQDGIVLPETRYQLFSGGSSFLNNYYYSTFGFVPEFRYEHAYVDWHVAPKGAYWLSAKPSPCIDLTLNFTDLTNFVSDPDDAVYFWDFGDGSGVSFDQDPTYTFTTPGTYTVTLIVTEGSESFKFEKTVLVDFCSDINDIESLTNFQVYPVPTNDVVNMNLNFTTPENVEISIANLQGQIVYTTTEKNVSLLSKSIDVSNLSAGSYVIKIANSTNIATKTFMITR